jgi:competence protein ComEA
MKNWQGVLIGILVGIIGMALIQLITAAPRGTPVELLPAATAGSITIHIDGEVASPGVFEIPYGSRIQDIIGLAGGLTEDADISSVNLAAAVTDGERVNIPCIEPTHQPESNVVVAVGTPVTYERININTATQEELEFLPGIGPVIAGRIIEYRQFYGPYQFIEDLQKVEGIGPAVFEKVKDSISVTH